MSGGFLCLRLVFAETVLMKELHQVFFPHIAGKVNGRHVNIFKLGAKSKESGLGFPLAKRVLDLQQGATCSCLGHSDLKLLLHIPVVIQRVGNPYIKTLGVRNGEHLFDGVPPGLPVFVVAVVKVLACHDFLLFEGLLSQG